MADDLEDDWWEETTEIDDLSKEEKKEAKAGKKRKKSTKDIEEVGEIANVIEKPSKKRKKKRNDDDNNDTSKINSSTLWNFFVDASEGKLSAMEIEELRPDEMDECYLKAKEFPASLTELPTYFSQVIPKWQKDMQTIRDKKGSPAMLIISGSAKRSVDVLRSIKGFKTSSCKTAKLFAKHFKLEDQEVFLSKNIIHIGIGTPNRILKLASDGYLKFKKLKYVMIDWNYKDVKQRRMKDIPEVREDVISLLQEIILPKLKDGKLKYGLF